MAWRPLLGERTASCMLSRRARPLIPRPLSPWALQCTHHSAQAAIMRHRAATNTQRSTQMCTRSLAESLTRDRDHNYLNLLYRLALLCLTMCVSTHEPCLVSIIPCFFGRSYRWSYSKFQVVSVASPKSKYGTCGRVRERSFSEGLCEGPGGTSRGVHWGPVAAAAGGATCHLDFRPLEGAAAE